ncbi:major facilitator superfamily domain-containing protein [Sordaria brevicollis]|uniref:Major facilitator superfamily domain-containing protein n=1 Tax=Sordaria brevicollis TaxID=83679 RepID=A0AAE0U906_SORBR|nr:major facilitator superfamily domain-containing protein [Sordaria brevicollis]
MALHSLHDLDPDEGTVRVHLDDNLPIVLNPKPSETNPNDPLNWSRRKKRAAFLAVCSFAFLANFGIGGLTPAFYLISVEFGKTQVETGALLLWPVLTLGAFNFFWVPIANYYGKRPVFVFSCALLCACSMWGAVADTFKSLLWSLIIAAFAGSSTEALGASIANDLYFLHERGAVMGVYMNFIAGGNTIGPLICGFIVAEYSWRWHKWLTFILTLVSFLAVVFLVPETTYIRYGQYASDSDSSRGSTPGLAARLQAEKRYGATRARAARSHLGHVDESQTPHLPKKSWVEELSVWPVAVPGTPLWKLFFRPFPMWSYPCVIFAFLAYAVSLEMTVAVNILNPFVFQAPPYNWSPMTNGLINIPGLIGNLFGSVLGGWMVDRFCNWTTKRNNGVYEPESRLWLCIVPLLISGSGCLVFGYGVERTLGWVSLFFGYGMISIALTAVPSITMAYVSDCLLPVNSDALMLVNGTKNIVCFFFAASVLVWVQTVGYIEAFGTTAGVFALIMIGGMLLLIPFGARIRHRQANWRIIL